MVELTAGKMALRRITHLSWLLFWLSAAAVVNGEYIFIRTLGLIALGSLYICLGVCCLLYLTSASHYATYVHLSLSAM